MKYAIFGTGSYCNQFISFFDEKDICFFVDNNVNKKMYMNKAVFLPTEADFSLVEYIVILIQACSEPMEQLLALGLSEEKIILYSDIAKHINAPISIHMANGERISTEQWMACAKNDKKILLITHELSRTGVPVAVMNMAVLLKQLDCDVLVGSLTLHGPLEEELANKELSYITGLGITKGATDYEQFIDLFDAVVLGTIALADYGRYLNFYKKKIVWWINERYSNLYDQFILPEHRENMLYFIDGKKTKQIFTEYYPDRITEYLYYCLSDVGLMPKIQDDTIVFAVIGSLSKRKAQDLFLQAALKTDADNVEFWIIGKGNELNIDFESVSMENSHIKYWSEVSQERLNEMFSKIDVLVCPSRDDTVPIVVSQAFQNSIPCIVSDNVGQSEYMLDGFAGEVFPSENVQALTDAIKKMIAIGSDRRAEIGKQGRILFEKYFSEAAIKNTVEKEIISKL